MTFAESIKKERERLGLTQAGLTDVFAKDKRPPSRRVLWAWEAGQTVPMDVTQEGILARVKSIK